MRLLLTNDDGIGSAGLSALADELGREHELWIVAPDAERSGCSHALSLNTHTKVMKVGDNAFACSGTPADCVILALSGLVPETPDLVLSGINRGANLGTDLVYSGTAAAARQASIMGLPAMALSIVSEDPPYHFAPAARFIAESLTRLKEAWEEGVFLNLNLPNRESAPAGIELAHPCSRSYRDCVSSFEAPDGSLYFFFGACDMSCEAAEGSDAWIVARGKAALSRIEILPRHKDAPWRL